MIDEPLLRAVPNCLFFISECGDDRPESAHSPSHPASSRIQAKYVPQAKMREKLGYPAMAVNAQLDIPMVVSQLIPSLTQSNSIIHIHLCNRLLLLLGIILSKFSHF